MQPVYINHIASIHADTASGESLICPPMNRITRVLSQMPHHWRRMSRIIKMELPVTGMYQYPTFRKSMIITATGLGCLADTEKFLNTIIENEEQLLNPTPFYPVNLQYHRSPNSITPPDTCLQHDVCAPGIEFRKCTIGRYDENLGR